jgi:hypothetical protein
MILRTYFGLVPSQIVFASPAVGKSFLNPLKDAIQDLEIFFANLKLNSKVVLFENGSFRQEVLLPTLKMASDTADSSELFLRSYRLLNLFDLDEKPKRPRDVMLRMGVGASPGASGNECNGTLPIDLEPPDMDKFKSDLLKCRRARIIIRYDDGRVRETVWNADKFRDSSNVMGNLRSRPEFRQGEWQRRGISRLIVQVASS